MSELSEMSEGRFKGIIDLGCDNCGVPLGYVKEFDLNESYFYCMNCFEVEQQRRDRESRAHKAMEELETIPK